MTVFEQYEAIEDRKAAHRFWFAAIAAKARINLSDSLKKRALMARDKSNLNSIPLRAWDIAGVSHKSAIAWAKFELGYSRRSASLSDCVCTLKELARQHIEANT